MLHLCLMKRSLRQALVGLVLPVVLLFTLSAQAATPAGGGASGLSISPLRQELTLKPGQADKIDITLKNITGGPVIAKASVQDFESDNVTGNPKILSAGQTSPASIRPFLVGLGDLPLNTGEQKTFNIPVQAPSNASPGAYYGLIEYQAVPINNANSSGNNKVALSAAVSQLVFITVPGNLTERMQLNAIHIYKDKTGGRELGVLTTSIPQAAGIELANLGNDFAKPFGRVTLQSSSGKTIYSYELNGNITRGIVLPHSSRIFIDQLKNIKGPGRYTITASISYGSGSAILTGRKVFWYLPAWVIIVIVAVVLLLIGA